MPSTELGRRPHGRSDPIWLAELDLWNAANERARLAYDADKRAIGGSVRSPIKTVCAQRCGRRTEHRSGVCARCRR